MKLHLYARNAILSLWRIKDAKLRTSREDDDLSTKEVEVKSISLSYSCYGMVTQFRFVADEVLRIFIFAPIYGCV